MTHNFNFFRTMEGRIARYPNCLVASRNDEGISLSRAVGIRNVFANDWKKNFFVDQRKMIASIPFLRNIVEMTTGMDDPNYLKLTSMLHRRADSEDITVKTLVDIFNKLCGTEGVSEQEEVSVGELIEEQANECLAEAPGLDLENKIVLAVATRLKAEEFIMGRLDDDAFLEHIESNQTQALIREFRKRYPAEEHAVKVLDRVALMTPENIHVNSFMYEPIIDMSDKSLKRLYEEACGL